MELSVDIKSGEREIKVGERDGEGVSVGLDWIGLSRQGFGFPAFTQWHGREYEPSN